MTSPTTLGELWRSFRWPTYFCYFVSDSCFLLKLRALNCHLSWRPENDEVDVKKCGVRPRTRLKPKKTRSGPGTVSDGVRSSLWLKPLCESTCSTDAVLAGARNIRYHVTLLTIHRGGSLETVLISRRETEAVKYCFETKTQQMTMVKLLLDALNTLIIVEIIKKTNKFKTNVL